MGLVNGTLLAGRYRIDGLLGRGGMGTVYKGYDTREDLPVAIKYLEAPDSDTAQQFAIEAQLLTQLRSARVPRSYEYLPNATPYGLALVMEYLSGEDLEERIERQGRLDEQTALRYISQVLEALIHLHHQRPSIIHRDIKPSNIKIDQHDNAWLLDLGIGKRFGTPTTRGAHAITPPYAPPEQYKPAIPSDTRTDIYAVGATLYHLLAGQPPLSAPQRLIGRKLKPLQLINPNVSLVCAQLTHKAMMLERNQRFPDADSMHRAVEALLDPDLLQRDQAIYALRKHISAHMPHAIVDHQVLPSQQAVYMPVDPPLPQKLEQACGITSLYRHQAESIERVRKGRDIVVVTGTASGKSMCFNLPILERCLANPRAHALYLFPIKALINDQTHKLQGYLQQLQAPHITAEALHGDLDKHERQQVRRHPPRLALSNPEFVHWMLARHPDWRLLFSRLQFIVLDEVHVYRGVFGSNVAQLLRRLLRICAFYGARPQIISCSATVSNPIEFVEKLTGRSPYLIDRDGAARVRRNVLFWKPIEIGKDVRRSASDDAVLVTTRAVEFGQQVITFARARQEVEQLVLMAHDAAQEQRVSPNIYSAYRGGYTRRERERIEASLRDGRIKGVFSTSALEMGVDIGNLQMSVLTGFPGSRMSFWQQAGRAGRRKEDAHIVFIGAPNPLDHYFLTKPDDLLYGPSEAAVVDLANEYILRKHLLCMAREQPISEREAQLFPPETRTMFDQLILASELTAQTNTQGQTEYIYNGSDFPHSKVSMRSATRDTFTIMCDGNPDPILGTIEPPNLYREAHEEAIYYHNGEGYRVRSIDMARQMVHVVPEKANHITRPRGLIEVSESQVLQTVDLHAQHISALCQFGVISVHSRIDGFKEYLRRPLRKLRDQDLPQPYNYDFLTKGFWLDIDPALQQEIDHLITESMKQAALKTGSAHGASSTTGATENVLKAALHGVEHLLLGLMPTVALCDRRDLGSVYREHLGEEGVARITIYDTYPGGIGLAERGFQNVVKLLERTYDTVTQCECTEGCPYCIQAGWCFEENQCLDKDATIYLLGRLLSRPTGNAQLSLPIGTSQSP